MSHVTMRDIGRSVGVSAVTVSKALAGKPGVSEEMRQRIVKTAQEMGYVNPIGGAPAHEARELDVGILIPDRFFSADSFYAMLYKLLVQSLTEAGHFGLLELLSDEAEADLALPNLLKSRRADALILLGQPSRAYLRMIAEQHVPSVFLDFYDEQASADAVVGDNTYGCYRLTSHLIKNGHTDIGFVGDIQATSSIMDRYLGFYKAMLSHDLPIRPECVLCDREVHGLLSPLRLPQKLPTAFVCNCDMVARSLIAQLQENNVRVPQDVSVVGFDDFSTNDAAGPALSTFRVDCAAMAQAAVQLVSERCAGMSRPFSRVVVSGHPIYRESEMPLGK